MVALDQPDVAIVDIRMPPTHTDEGLVAARRIRQRYPTPRSSCSASTWSPGMPSGCSPTSPVASATCSRNVSDVAVLVDALRRVTEGECVVDPTIVARLMQRRRPDSPLTLLTPRERDILALMAEGRSTPASPASSVSVNGPSRRPAPSCSASLAWSPPQT